VSEQRQAGEGPHPIGGPAAPVPSPAGGATTRAKPGGTGARTRRGSDLPHRIAQAPGASAEDPRSYYGQPVIKAPVWRGYIPWYLFTGGLAGASAPLAALAPDDVLARRAWSVSLGALAVSAPLLIADLGRPERFHHMLRLVKVTSPMSVGTWLLSATGGAVALAWTRSVLGWFPRAGGAGAGATLALGPALSTYTSVLIADTAVPAWHEARRELPFVFAASSAAAAGGAATLVTPVDSARVARRLAVAGGLAEVAATMVMERRLGELGAPYRHGRPAWLMRGAKVCAVAGAGLVGTGGRRRGLAAAGGVLLVAGSALERWAIFRAGVASAQDPRYTVAPQRRRKDARARARQAAAPA
jgi:hypothetical protein